MPDDYRFGGFDSPNYTQIPDVFFDELMVHLSEAELRVLLYVMRRTFGFKKRADSISINQMVSGITARDGTVLDLGCGLGRTAVKKGVAGLVGKGVLLVEKSQSENGEYETNIYSLVVREVTGGRSLNGQGVGHETTYPGSPGDPPVGREVTLQETVEQQTVKQETGVEASKGPPEHLSVPIEDRITIDRYITDFARELNDQAPLSSSSTRAARIYALSGVSIETFLDAMQEARRRTQLNSGGIRTQPAGGITKPKMGYWFSVLEDLVGVKAV